MTKFDSPPFRTPQGIACIAFSSLAIAGGIAYLIAPLDIASWPMFRLGAFLFFWPVILFFGYIHLGYADGYRASLSDAFVLSIAGVCPFVGGYIFDAFA